MDLYLKKHLIYNDKINKDFTIFTLSDLHIDKNFNFEILKSLINEANSSKPHSIFILGDLVNDASVLFDFNLKGIIKDFIMSLGLISPVFIIRGERDLLSKENKCWKSMNTDSFYENLKDINNVHVLLNNTFNLQFNNVSISGQDLGKNAYQFYKMYDECLEAYFYYVSSDIRKMESAIDPNNFNMLLIHSPINPFNREFINYSLVLSGHMLNGYVPCFLDNILPGDVGFFMTNGKLRLFPRNSRGKVSLDRQAIGIVCPPVNYDNNNILKKLYKPSASYIHVKSTK